MVSYKRVIKPLARKMYNCGISVLLIPCRVNESVLTNKDSIIQPVTISILDSDSDINRFDRAVNNFEYYNCNADLGYYSHYYVSEEDYNNYYMCQLMCK